MKVFSGGLLVTMTRPEHVPQLDKLQRIVFPTIAAHDRFSGWHYHEHIRDFPLGQFVVLDGSRLVGMSSTLRMDVDFDHPDHDFDDVSEGGWERCHRPEGRWMYGTDLGVHPEYRRRGVARALYAARQEAVRLLGLEGQVIVGMLHGYAAHRDAMSIEAYYAGVVTGTIQDPTVSAQLRMGFEPRGLVEGYVEDTASGGWGVFLVLPATRPVAYPPDAVGSLELGAPAAPPVVVDPATMAPPAAVVASPLAAPTPPDTPLPPPGQVRAPAPRPRARKPRSPRLKRRR